MWTAWLGDGFCAVELDAGVTPDGLALEVLVVEGWAIWMLEDGRVLRIAAAGVA